MAKQLSVAPLIQRDAALTGLLILIIKGIDKDIEVKRLLEGDHDRHICIIVYWHLLHFVQNDIGSLYNELIALVGHEFTVQAARALESLYSYQVIRILRCSAVADLKPLDLLSLVNHLILVNKSILSD